MITNRTYNNEISTYWNIIKDVKDDIKIRLITLLSESLTSSLSIKAKTEKTDATDKFLRRFYGAWEGKESAEEIIAKINEGKTCKAPVSFE